MALCTHSTLEEALSHAQSLFPIIPKAHEARIKPRDKPEYSYRYADLGDIVEAVKPILHQCGLSVTQPIGFEKGTDLIRTTLMHTSGGRVKSKMRLTLSQSTPQATGSLITYFRRYAYCAMLGIVSDVDDDGTLAEAAYGADAPRSRRRAAPRSSTSTRGKPARARTDSATEGRTGWSAKDRNKVVSHLAHLDPPIRGGDAQELHVKTLLGLEEAVPLVKLDAEQGDALMAVLGIDP